MDKATENSYIFYSRVNLSRKALVVKTQDSICTYRAASQEFTWTILLGHTVQPLSKIIACRFVYARL